MRTPEQLLEVVLEHVSRENAHDLPGIMATFGSDGLYDDTPWKDARGGLDGVRQYYIELLAALPDLHIAIERKIVSSDAVVLEVRISGTHLGLWRGLPATGRKLNFPLCGIFTFDADGKLAGEKIYYDRGTVLAQLGLFHDPRGVVGGLEAALAHPVTIARAYLRKLGGRNRLANPGGNGAGRDEKRQ